MVANSSSADRVNIYLYYATKDVQRMYYYPIILLLIPFNAKNITEHFTHEHFLTQKHFITTKNNFTVPSDLSASLAVPSSFTEVRNTHERPDSVTSRNTFQ